MKSRKFLRWGYNTLVVILLLTGIYFVVAHFVHFGNSEITDNATIYRHITPVNTRVQGFIREIRFDDYQEVHKGDTLVVIDDSEFCLRLAQAEADLASATAGGRVTSSGVNTAQRQVNVSMAGIEEARVHLENAEREEKRYAQLLKNDAVTPQQYDAVHTAYLSAKARYEQALRQSSALTAVKTEQNHRLGQTDAAIRLAKAQVDMARLNLSYTVIVATADGFSRYSGAVDSVSTSARPFSFGGFMGHFVEGLTAQGIKTLYGWTLYAAIVITLFLLLWDLPAVRRRVHRVPTWPSLGMQMWRGFQRQQKLRRLRRMRWAKA